MSEKLFTWKSVHRIAEAIWQDSPKSIEEVEQMQSTVYLIASAPRNALRREPVWFQTHYEMMNQMCLTNALLFKATMALYDVLWMHGLSVLLEEAFGPLTTEARNFFRRLVWK